MFKKPDYSVIASFLLLVIILLFFVLATQGKMVSVFNIKAILDQTVIVVVAGLGVMFVVAQGGADLSVGTTVGITTVGGAAAATVAGSEWIIIPVAFAIALVQGLVNGFIVAKLRVPSFMVTLAMLIGVRGLVNFVQSKQDGLYYLQNVVGALRDPAFKYALLVVLIIIFFYILTYTKFGEYCKAIGENEAVAYSVGIPVHRFKIYAFMLSSVMAAIAGFYTMAKVGGTNQTMGTNLEIDVVMGIFLGGVLVTGGYGAKISKLLIGSFTLSVLKNGMMLIRLTSIFSTEATRGVMLMLVLFLTMQVDKKGGGFVNRIFNRNDRAGDSPPPPQAA
jgi:ribose transport system permease protein